MGGGGGPMSGYGRPMGSGGGGPMGGYGGPMGGGGGPMGGYGGPMGGGGGPMSGYGGPMGGGGLYHGSATPKCLACTKAQPRPSALLVLCAAARDQRRGPAHGPRHRHAAAHRQRRGAPPRPLFASLSRSALAIDGQLLVIGKWGLVITSNY